MLSVLVGAIAPIPFWLWQRWFPDTRLKIINLPSCSTVPPRATRKWDQLRELIHRRVYLPYVFIYLLFVLFCSVVSGWAGLMGAPRRDAELWSKFGGSPED